MTDPSTRVLLVNFGDDTLLQAVSELLAAGSTGFFSLNLGRDRISRGTWVLSSVGQTRTFSLFNTLAEPSANMNSVPSANVMEVSELLRQSPRDFDITADRVWLQPLSMTSRVNQRFFHLNNSLMVLDSAEPHTVLFDDIPHLPWDICLAEAAMSRGIRVYALCPTHLDYRFDVWQLQAEGRKLVSRTGIWRSHDRTSREQFPKVTSEHGTRMQEARQINSANQPEGKFPSAGALADVVAGSVHRFVVGHDVPYWRLGRVRNSLNEIGWWRNRHRLRNVLGEVAIREAPAMPFVYFALHYQPERTSIPEGLDNWHQLYPILQLAAAIPSNWKVVVREHPRQVAFNDPNPREINYRTIRDYEQIMRIPNVLIASLDTPSRYWIEHCSLTASVTGSTPWEGLAQGKAGLCFAPTFYSDSRAIGLPASSRDVGRLVAELSGLTPSEILVEHEGLKGQLDKDLAVGAIRESWLHPVDRSRIKDVVSLTTRSLQRLLAMDA